MTAQRDHLSDLAEIRLMMERSSRFLTLSGLSGVFAGVYALIGAAAAYYYLPIPLASSVSYYELAIGPRGGINWDFVFFFVTDAGLVLLLSLATGYYFTLKRTKKHNHKLWNSTSKRLLLSLMIPLIAGGIYCLILFDHREAGLIAPATLIFYGLALLNAGKYTLDEIKYLGACEIALGLAASVYTGYGLLFWAFGFGFLHILYGALMYNKYDRKEAAA